MPPLIAQTSLPARGENKCEERKHRKQQNLVISVSFYLTEARPGIVSPRNLNKVHRQRNILASTNKLIGCGDCKIVYRNAGSDSGSRAGYYTPTHLNKTRPLRLGNEFILVERRDDIGMTAAERQSTMLCVFVFVGGLPHASKS